MREKTKPVSSPYDFEDGAETCWLFQDLPETQPMLPISTTTTKEELEASAVDVDLSNNANGHSANFLLILDQINVHFHKLFGEVPIIETNANKENYVKNALFRRIQKERERRAHLKECQEELKALIDEVLPDFKGSLAHLLKTAKSYIDILYNKEKKLEKIKEDFVKEIKGNKEKIGKLMKTQSKTDRNFHSNSSSEIQKFPVHVNAIADQFIEYFDKNCSRALLTKTVTNATKNIQRPRPQTYPPSPHILRKNRSIPEVAAEVIGTNQNLDKSLFESEEFSLLLNAAHMEYMKLNKSKDNLSDDGSNKKMEEQRFLKVKKIKKEEEKNEIEIIHLSDENIKIQADAMNKSILVIDLTGGDNDEKVNN